MSMTDFPTRSRSADHKSSAPAPEHGWISEQSTLNPSPGPLLKQRRDTAEGCRERATADLLEAVTMATAHSRQMFERSSAAWTARAEVLHRIESSIECERSEFPLTAGEIAEDAAHIRL
jgi:hypothetical protein